MAKTFTDEQLDFIRKNFDKMTYKEIGTALNKQWRSVEHQVRKMGLKKTPDWTDEEEQFLKDNVGILTYEEMSQAIGKTRSAVQSKISKMKLGVTPPQYTYNADYFEVINTPDKAYWLGFIMADGCIADRGDGYLRVKIALKREDADHLRKFVKCLEANLAVKENFVKTKGKIHEQALLTINSHKMAQDLIKLGAVQNKTYGLTHPDLRDDLKSHYLRGFVDGDGCFYYGKRKNQLGYRHTIEIVAKTAEPLEFFKEYLSEHGISSKVYHVVSQDKMKLYIMSKDDIRKAIELIYKDSQNDTRLERKFIKANELLEIAVNGGNIIEDERAKSVES